MKFKSPYTKIFYILILSISVGFYLKDKQPEHFNLNYIIKKYQHNADDSLKLICAKFIKANIDTIYTGNDFNLTNKFIEQNIEEAANDWQECLWNKAASKEFFLNYLLPYQLYDEDPNNWRSYFSQKYKSIKDSFKVTKTLDTRKVYDRIINKDVNQWLHYSDYMPEDFAYNFKEIMKNKEANCVGMAYMYAYALRSVGIPSSVDFVPLWGSQNAGHAEVVFIDSSGKMVTYEENRLSKSAKILRYTYKKQNIWSDSIKPKIGGYDFLLSNLINDNWLDVTKEHTKTSTIKYTLPSNCHVPFAYICVYNYGEWQPAFYGLIDNHNIAQFSNMGCNIFYQIAIPKEEGYELVGRSFIVDSLGKIVYLNPDLSNKINMNLHKINDGYLSYVKKGEKYQLYMLDQQNKWQYLNDYTCSHDSTIFEKKNTSQCNV